MNHADFVKELKEMDACGDAIEFVVKNKYDLKQAWNNCERADWMLWLACKKEMFTIKDRTHAICDCAETALKYVPKGEERPRLAIEAARRYADKRTDKNLQLLNAAGDAAWAAAWTAAWAAARAAGAAGSAAWVAGDAAWAAAWTAARDAAGAAAGAAGAAAHKEMCVLIRERMGI